MQSGQSKFEKLQCEKGVLIKTSVAIRIRLKQLDEKEQFIIADLDDHHLFVEENQKQVPFRLFYLWWVLALPACMAISTLIGTSSSALTSTSRGAIRHDVLRLAGRRRGLL